MTVARVEQRLTPPLPLGDDLRPLRDHFAGLMDRIASEIHALRLDLDDCVLQRWATVRAVGTALEQTIVVESLTDRNWLLKPPHDKCLQSMWNQPGRMCVEVVTIAVCAIRVADYPPQQTV